MDKNFDWNLQKMNKNSFISPYQKPEVILTTQKKDSTITLNYILIGLTALVIGLILGYTFGFINATFQVKNEGARHVQIGEQDGIG